MASELDLSLHSLNTSTSKQKFSFPKTERFRSGSKILCDSYYQIPSTKTSRAPGFGFGKKDIGIRNDKYIPPIGTYELGTQFKKNESKGFSFGSGRDQMELGGPLKDVKLLKFVPGPGQYDALSGLDDRASSLKSRLPDHSQKHLLKNPGPGTYNYEQIGGKMYYATSKYRNYTNHKISPGSRLSQIGKKSTIDIGPGTYCQNIEDINPKGRYSLSNHENSKSRIFDKSPRPQLVYKHMIGVPGPGQYGSFSSFGI